MTTRLQEIEIKDFQTEEDLVMLKSEWLRLCEQVAVRKADLENLFEQIISKYNQPGRKYHNLSHIKSMLRLSALYRDQISDSKSFDLGIWFHDSIYNSFRKDNEVKSAEWADECLQPFVMAETIEVTKQLILSTNGHHPILTHSDNYFFLDFDLAILAAERTVYIDYSKRIGQEYKHVPGFLFKKGRKKVLKEFLKRERLYFTDEFYNKYEQFARENLQWEIKNL